MLKYQKCQVQKTKDGDLRGVGILAGVCLGNELLKHFFVRLTFDSEGRHHSVKSPDLFNYVFITPQLLLIPLYTEESIDGVLLLNCLSFSGRASLCGTILEIGLQKLARFFFIVLS
ncbi:hypothetical protein CEXT_149001 [Caerostris extrusa]|uniref:Uncharacterized protein n=1 Tax=Caerostris extrusa TaxID=172846 RepID=A0AAV4Y646_CAEEX|nr:hypothetical protein CEXT_149001 [Caerostris extrusa]